MRSHAKASTAGSNSGGGRSLRSRRPGALIASLLICLCAVVCLLPGAALAAETRLPVESFGPDGTGVTSFESPNALAFDQGNKHLGALDALSHEVHAFDASTPGAHTPLGGNFPLSVAEGGLSPDLAIDSASHNIYYASTEAATVSGFDATGTLLGGNFPLAGLVFPGGVTVDSSGNIWVGDLLAEAVKEYDSAGNPIGSVNANQGFPGHVALDSDANLYVSYFEGATWKYTALSAYTTAIKVDSLAGESRADPIAVDRSNDDLYIVHTNRVSVYDSGGNAVYEFGAGVSGAQYTGIAIDEAADRVYLSDAAHGKIQVFGSPVPLPSVTTEDADKLGNTFATLNGTVNPEGKPLTDCHFEYVTEAAFKSTGYSDLSSGGSVPCAPVAASIPPDSNPQAVKAEISGLSASTTYRFRLVAASAEGTANGNDRTLTTAIGLPAISEQTAEAIGTTDVTLSAKINPKGAKTTYHVEYGTTASYGQSSAESVPIGFSTDNSNHNVSVHIGGLNPGTAYHFRFVATSLVGKAEGADASFATFTTTPGFGSCPNDQFRTGFGSRLSDCRAYEQVSPVDKHGANVQGLAYEVQASVTGDRVTFYLRGGLATTGGGSSTLAPFMASRGPSGWSSDGLMLLLEPGLEGDLVGWSDDLTTTFVGGEVPAGLSFFLRDSATAAYESLFTAPRPATGKYSAELGGYAADTSHLTFETYAPLLPDAATKQSNLYDLNHGALTLPGRIPVASATSCDDAGGPACVPAPQGAFAGNNGIDVGVGGGYSAYHAISRDGSKVYFTDRASGQLYVREDGTRTRQISASQKTNGSGPGGSDPLGPKAVNFGESTPDGSHVFFTSPEELTDDAKTGVGPAIGRANLDGSLPNHSFIELPAAANGVAANGFHIYWVNTSTGTIGRANLDGTGVEQSFITGASKPQYVAVDGSHVYWTNAANGTNSEGTIGRANLDGTGVEQSFITGASNPRGIAVDSSFIYWANAGTTAATRAIGRANLDGTGVEQSFIPVTAGSTGPSGVAVNASFVYWTNPASGVNSIGRATISGGSAQQEFVKSLIIPRGLALDGTYLYWANSTIFNSGVPVVASRIGRVKLDGSERDDNFIRNNDGQGVAVDGAHIYWAGADVRDTSNDLYRYDNGSGELVDLSVDSSPVNTRGADVQGLLGATPDGSYVYFVANGVLAPGASPGGAELTENNNIRLESTNLYVSHDGTTEFIAQLHPREDMGNWRFSSQRPSRVADDGTLVFSSKRLVDLSGHDHGSSFLCQGPCTQFYRYSPSDGELNCVTCTPSGTPPSGGISLGSAAPSGPGILVQDSPNATIIPRNLSVDGDRFFFESRDPLLPSDTNGVNDVYEWEAKGSGSCESESQNGGCLYLISSGTSPAVSRFADASANGDHVFFFTDQPLVPGDGDQLTDVYDAAVGGGLAAQHELAPPTCSSTACQANPAPPPDPTLSSASFSGAGNLREGKGSSARRCPKGKRKVRRAGKVRCQKAHKAKQHKRHNNRGGSK